MIYKSNYTNFAFCLILLIILIFIQLIFFNDINSILFYIIYYLILFFILYIMADKLIYSLIIEDNCIKKISLKNIKTKIKNEQISKVTITIVTRATPNVVFYYSDYLNKGKKVEFSTSDRVVLKKIYEHYKKLNKEVIIIPKERENIFRKE